MVARVFLGSIELCAHTKQTGVRIAELSVFDDVAVDLKQRPADRVHDASSVRTGQGK
jgi:hypothetical protein